jgi:hypothetical protein
MIATYQNIRVLESLAKNQVLKVTVILLLNIPLKTGHCIGSYSEAKKK